MSWRGPAVERQRPVWLCGLGKISQYARSLGKKEFVGIAQPPQLLWGGVEARRSWARVRTWGNSEEDIIILLNIINQGEMLHPAGKKDVATHHAVKKLGNE